ncbi:MAG: trigger factor [Candidatus Moranbacteria bacterium]|nr:trigger factor [Candidatus Moranbacteria bacterium]
MIKKLTGSKVEITREIPSAVWEKYIASAVSDAASEFKFQGFRPGKAPRHLVEQKVGKDIILNNAAEKAIRKDYVDYVVAEKMDVIGMPEVKIVKLTEGEPMTYEARVAVMPEIKIDAKYKDEVKKVNAEFSGKTFEADEKEVELELERLANSRAKLVTVMREAKNEDAVEIDFSVLVGGVPIEGGTSKNHALVIGKGVFIPGFEENLIGMKEGDEKEFELSFPKDYHKEDLKGKLATFKVKMNMVQEREIPKVDDEFAKSLGNFENLEAIKKNMREGMAHENEHRIKEERNAKYIEAMIANFKGELPETMISEELKKMMHEFEHQVGSMGMTMDEYLARIGKKKSDMEKDWKPQAEKRVKSALALREISKEESIEVPHEEIEAEMNKTLQYYKSVKNVEKDIDLERLYNYTKVTLENDKVFEMLEKLK